MSDIWDPFLTERDRQVFAAGGFGAKGGFGKRPAFLIIDVSWAFCGEKSEPILDSIKKWPNSCGEDAWVAIPYIAKVADACRAKGLPVIYTTGVVREDKWDIGSWGFKNSRVSEDAATASAKARVNLPDGNEIVSDIAPEPQDIVVLKQKPSGFYGTNLLAYLQLLGCDSVFVVGTTTSGCVRATVIDAFSNNIRVAVIEEGCFDRVQANHAINLADMHAKYADVVKTEEVLAFIDTLPAGMFDLPKGKAA
ncbi:isochorismatase family protein [Prosthecomicrobium sp. N25]|uniref:isochorismatase family protein n=1 Tax=Prosthecomicrobium sp. N25 TaxID=3129254 RepID=UPI0030788428